MKRATVYFEENLHKALKMKSAEISPSVSDLINDAVRAALLEDTEDLEAFRKREHEPAIDFETFVASLNKNETPTVPMLPKQAAESDSGSNLHRSSRNRS